MWVFTSQSFVSIVSHRDDPAVLIVRGRFAGDAARFLGLPPEAEEVTPDADYRFRCYAARQEVMERAAIAVSEVGYGNFKKTIGETWRERLAMAVWGILFREQNARAPKPRQRYLWPDRNGEPAHVREWIDRAADAGWDAPVPDWEPARRPVEVA